MSDAMVRGGLDLRPAVLLIRDACRKRMPLGGVDAEVLEFALTQVEEELRQTKLQNREYREALEKVYKRLNDTVPAGYDIYPELSKLVAQALVEKRAGEPPITK